MLARRPEIIRILDIGAVSRIGVGEDVLPAGWGWIGMVEPIKLCPCNALPSAIYYIAPCSAIGMRMEIRNGPDKVGAKVQRGALLHGYRRRRIASLRLNFTRLVR